MEENSAQKTHFKITFQLNWSCYLTIYTPKSRCGRGKEWTSELYDVQVTPGCSKPENTKDLSNLQDKKLITISRCTGGLGKLPGVRIFQHLLKVLQMSETALKTLSEKLTLTLTYFMLGSCRRSSLC